MSYKLYNTHGFRIYLDADESQMMKARTKERYEPYNFQYIKKHLKEGMVFLDVGANKGDFTLLAASLGAEVLSFEPIKENYEWLLKSVAENDFSNVLFFNLAVTDKTGWASITLSDISGHHSMKKEGVKREVGTIKLDDFSLDRCDMIKIDVEGAEDLVLEGARSLINKYKPTILLDIHKDLTDVGVLEEVLSDYRIYTPVGGRVIDFYDPPSVVIAEPIRRPSDVWSD